MLPLILTCTRKNKIPRFTLKVGLLIIAALAGCSGDTGVMLELSGVAAKDASLVDAPAIAMPEQGATALANTYWYGQENCQLTGDISMSFGGTGGIPSTNSLLFDAKGFPSGVSSSLSDMGGVVQLKRANFTPTSFDLAYTMSLAVSAYGSSITEGYIEIYSGKLSADGTTLTGKHTTTAYYTGTGVSYSGIPGDNDFVISQECTYTMTKS